VFINLRNITLSPRLNTSSLPWATGFALFLVGLHFLAPETQQLLWYQRAAVADGEWWRLLTGSLVHLGSAHLALNVGALVIGTWLFHAARNPLAWLLAMVVTGTATNMGLYLVYPDIQWCIGMSGALHGLLMIGALDWWRQGERIGLFMAIGWTAKIAWEQSFGAVPLSEATVGAAVVTEAHLWGAIGGLVYVAAERWWQRQFPAPAPL
jgi:rhomboid family GlyGly-CTERM serine protease